MDNDLTIQVQIGEHTLYRKYSLTDGQAPDNMQEEIQDIVDTLLDKEKVL